MLKVMFGEVWLVMGVNCLCMVLIMFGMVIGVGVVVIMLVIGQGVQYVVQQMISMMGLNLFIVFFGFFMVVGVCSGLVGVFLFNVVDVEVIVEFDGVVNVVLMYQGNW